MVGSIVKVKRANFKKDATPFHWAKGTHMIIKQCSELIHMKIPQGRILTVLLSPSINKWL